MKPPQHLKQKAEKKLPPAIKYIAKTILSPDGKNQSGVDVLTHCKIVGLVARELIHRQHLWLNNIIST